MIQCAKHGLQFLVPCCEHIAGAVHDGAHAQVHVLFNRGLDAVALCDGCRDDVLGQIARAPRRGFSDLDRDPAPMASCEIDFDEWLGQTGQGRMATVVEAARANRPAWSAIDVDDGG